MCVAHCETRGEVGSTPSSLYESCVEPVKLRVLSRRIVHSPMLCNLSFIQHHISLKLSGVFIWFVWVEDSVLSVISLEAGVGDSRRKHSNFRVMKIPYLALLLR
jgi:hypothetical protein